MKFTAQQLMRSFMKDDIELLSSLKVNKYDLISLEIFGGEKEPLGIELLNGGQCLFKS